MVPLTLGDHLLVTLLRHSPPGSPAIDLQVRNADLPVHRENLAFRAAEAFQTFSDGKLPAVRIILEKNIPVGAGLGGGSSDAAAVLLALNHLLEQPHAPSELHALGKSLGADVPFFLGSGAFRATGIGDCLEACVSKREVWFILVNPGFSVSTAWVYQNFKSAAGNSLAAGVTPRDLEVGSWCNLLKNDLERVTLSAYPELIEIKKRLLAVGADGTLMSGSGPTVFGLFEGSKAEATARQAYGELLRDGKDWKIFLARNLNYGLDDSWPSLVKTFPEFF
jgi:4-diphosphocytidyl-2-C-methyl-D-erythritol kinase